jgi:hypothetical protein
VDALNRYIFLYRRLVRRMAWSGGLYLPNIEAGCAHRAACRNSIQDALRAGGRNIF